MSMYMASNFVDPIGILSFFFAPPMLRPLVALAAAASSHITPQLCQTEPTGALLALSLPSAPAPELGPALVVSALCRGLQHNDVPAVDAGLERLYRFATFECRAALTARKGKNSVERFCRYAESPALTDLLHSTAFTVAEDVTLIAGTQTRGALATVVVDVTAADPGFRTRSGLERSAEERARRKPPERYLFTMQARSARPPARPSPVVVCCTCRNSTLGTWRPWPVAAAELCARAVEHTPDGYPVIVMVNRRPAQKERRPPLQDCWLLKELLPMRHHMIFAGDSGGC